MRKSGRNTLSYCHQRGDTRGTLLMKAHDLLWVAHRLQKYPDLDISMAQLLAVSTDWRDRKLAYGQKLKNWSITSERFINVARPWLRYLGYLSKPDEPVPLCSRLDEHCLWAIELAFGSEPGEGVREVIARCARRGGIGVVEAHRQARQRGDLRDASAHCTTADDTSRLDNLDGFARDHCVAQLQVF